MDKQTKKSDHLNGAVKTTTKLIKHIEVGMCKNCGEEYLIGEWASRTDTQFQCSDCCKPLENIEYYCVKKYHDAPGLPFDKKFMLSFHYCPDCFDRRSKNHG